MHIQTKIEKQLERYREWAAVHTFARCRLVHYCGFEFCGAADVALKGVEPEIGGYMSEGLQVDWTLENNCLFLVIWESWNLPIEWNCVFEERDFESDWSWPDIAEQPT